MEHLVCVTRRGFAKPLHHLTVDNNITKKTSGKQNTKLKQTSQATNSPRYRCRLMIGLPTSWCLLLWTQSFKLRIVRYRDGEPWAPCVDSGAVGGLARWWEKNVCQHLLYHYFYDRLKSSNQPSLCWIRLHQRRCFKISSTSISEAAPPHSPPSDSRPFANSGLSLPAWMLENDKRKSSTSKPLPPKPLPSSVGM